jgi:hypothetical protein
MFHGASRTWRSSQPVNAISLICSGGVDHEPELTSWLGRRMPADLWNTTGTVSQAFALVETTHAFFLKCRERSGQPCRVAQ